MTMGKGCRLLQRRTQSGGFARRNRLKLAHGDDGDATARVLIIYPGLYRKHQRMGLIQRALSLESIAGVDPVRNAGYAGGVADGDRWRPVQDAAGIELGSR